MSNKKFRNGKRTKLEWSKLNNLVIPMIDTLKGLGGINAIATMLFIKIEDELVRKEHLEFLQATVGQTKNTYDELLSIYKKGCNETGLVPRKKIDLVESLIQRSVELGLRVSNDILPAMENIQILIEEIQETINSKETEEKYLENFKQIEQDFNTEL